MTYTVAPEQIHDNLETLARLHSSCRQRKGQPGNFCVPEYLNFHHEVAERMARAGYLYLAQLRCNARPVAALYGFHLGTVLFGYQVGYSNAFAVHGVGSLLQGFTIQDAIERLHATEYDFLQGDEAYKYSWTKHRRQTRAIVLWKRNLAGELSRREFLLRRRLSPGKQRVQILWESAGQHLRSAYRNTLAPTRGQ
jgi:CelD/BcsL family acetyltransferase involved in cellulose biosynthesis